MERFVDLLAASSFGASSREDTAVASCTRPIFRSVGSNPALLLEYKLGFAESPNPDPRDKWEAPTVPNPQFFNLNLRMGQVEFRQPIAPTVIASASEDKTAHCLRKG